MKLAKRRGEGINQNFHPVAGVEVKWHRAVEKVLANLHSGERDCHTLDGMVLSFRFGKASSYP